MERPEPAWTSRPAYTPRSRTLGAWIAKARAVGAAHPSTVSMGLTLVGRDPLEILECRCPLVLDVHLLFAKAVFHAEGRPIKQCDRRPAAGNLCLGLEPEQHDHSFFIFETAARKKPSSLKVYLRIGGLRKLCDGFFINTQIRFERVLGEMEILAEANPYAGELLHISIAGSKAEQLESKLFIE